MSMSVLSWWFNFWPLWHGVKYVNMSSLTDKIVRSLFIGRVCLSSFEVMWFGRSGGIFVGEGVRGESSLLLHPPILKPDLDLSVAQTEAGGDLDPSDPGQVAVEMEFFFQLRQLSIREIRSTEVRCYDSPTGQIVQNFC